MYLLTNAIGYGYGNNYTTSYTAQGDTDGGGFVQGEAHSSQAGGKTDYGKKTIRPVTVKQMIDATRPHQDADFKIDGDVALQVTFVAQVRSVNTAPTKITYKVDDGTAIIDVQLWTDANQDEMDLGDGSKPRLEDGVYCRVWGMLKDYYDKRHVQAHIIRPVTDMNEIHYHLLEATAVHLFFKYGPPQTDANGQSKGPNGQADVKEDVIGGRAMPSHLSPRAKMVYKFMREQPQSNEGVHVQMIATGVGMDVNQVYSAAEELVTCGLTFTTVDENTWAVLDY